MRKLLAMVLVVLVMVSMFVGCGVQSETGDITSSTSDEKKDNNDSIEAVVEDEEVIAEEKSVEEKAKEAIETLNVWDGSIAESYAGGNGSIDNPYQIATAEQLAKLSYDTNNGVTFSGVYFELTNDIMLNDISYWNFDDLKANENIGDYWTNEWTSIGKFSGSFDGNGHTIYGICGSCEGLFYAISQDEDFSGTVSNLNCVCSYFNYDLEKTTIYVFGVISRSLGYYATIDNCHVAQSVILNYDSEIGGICGSADRGNITNCSTHNIYISGSSNDDIGGICGSICNATVSNCYADVTIDLDSVKLSNVGGICGGSITNNDKECIIENCYSTIDIELVNGSSTSSGSVVNIGGVIGSAEGTTITNCGSSGVISYNGNNDVQIGGIVAYFYLKSKNENSTELSHCYSNISINSDCDSTISAGIVGVVDNQSLYSASIEVTDCNYNNEYSSKGIGDAGSSSFSNNIYGHTEEELKDISNYIDWDFDTIWMIDNSLNDGLPILRSLAKYFQN
ncbi:MAG: hypothetical protein LUF29_07355 [Oscillospiraceae bacterium]|nr:hypothetical protein [Oscillospiraceae bacterium]